MKKTFLTFAVLLAATAMFVTSCSEDDEEEATSKKCVCTEYEYSGKGESETLDPASWGATNCKDLAIKLNMQMYDSDFYYECR
ncbi:MAG: hypothetical protein IJF06_03105 [Bacteroidaceae bacterium]|nr:hypothetical protein [Bacteroidaceae bacterium]